MIVFISIALLFPLVVLLLFKRYNYDEQQRQRLLAALPSDARKWPLLGHLPLFFDNSKPRTAVCFEMFNSLAEQFRNDGLFYLRLGPQDMVHVFSPNAVEAVLSSSVHIYKSPVYKKMSEWLGSGLIVSSGRRWHRDRKMLTPSFHFKILEQFISTMNEKSNIFCDVIETQQLKLTDVMDSVSKLALDNILETSFGIKSDLQTKGSNSYSRNFHKFAKLFVSRNFYPLLTNDFIYALTSDGRKSKLAISKLHKFTMDIVEKRRSEMFRGSSAEVDANNNCSKAKPLLDLMLDINLSSSEDMNLVDIRSQLDSFIFAGHDTVAAALTFALFELSHRSDIQQKIRDELKDVLSGQSEITIEHLRNLKYMDMVIRETLRLHAPVPFIARYLKSDLQIGERTIPAHVELWINIHALHLDPKIWPDPTTFDPNRFSSENARNRHPFAFTPFSGGLRNCIGQRYAMNMMKLTLSRVMSRYRIKPVTERSDIHPALELTLKTLQPIAIQLEKDLIITK